VSATLATDRPEAAGGRAAFVALAARELRRFVVNPVLLFAVGMTLWTASTDQGEVVHVFATSPDPAIFLGGFGMMATYWLTRSMRHSEPVVGVTPIAEPVRTAALCVVAIVPLLFGCVALFMSLHFYPVGSPVYGDFSRPTQVAILVGQMVVPALGGPLLGIALGRWVHFPGAALLLFLLLFGWANLVSVPSLTHPDAAPSAALRLFSPFAFWAFTDNTVHVTPWRGSPWFFLGWQLALCAIAVLVALLRGADSRIRPRIVRALWFALAVAGMMFVLALVAGVPHAVVVR
jgi:hypothetical protein